MSDTQVFETENVRVTCYDANLPRMVVSFDIWRKDRNGFPPPKPSGFYKQNGMAYLTIQSAHNDWYLSADLPELCKTLSQFTTQFDRITALGFSMGGYGALLLSRALHLNQVVLVSPQSSIFPARAPFEDRYLQEATRLDPALDTLAENPRRGLRGVLLYDPSDMKDMQHTEIITRLYPNIIRPPRHPSDHTGQPVCQNPARTAASPCAPARIYPPAQASPQTFAHIPKPVNPLFGRPKRPNPINISHSPIAPPSPPALV